MLEVLERYRILTLAMERRMTQREAAKELNLSLSHTKRLVKRFKEAGGSYKSLAYRRTHPASNRLPENIRNKIIALKRENKERSNPLIAELVLTEFGVKVHPNTVRNILLDSGDYSRSYRRKPLRCLEAGAFGQIVQVATCSGSWLKDYRCICLVLVMDDYSHTILAARFFDSNSTYNTMIVLKEAVERYGIFLFLYGDNSSKFRLTRREESRFFCYNERTSDGEVITELHRALLELGITLMTHLPGNSRTKRKAKKLLRLVHERFILKHRADNLNELNLQLQRWIDWYNNHHFNRDIECVPLSRHTPGALKPLDGINLDDIFCLKEERKVGKDHSFSLNGVTYNIPERYNIVASKIKVHIHPGEKIRVWHGGQCLCELPHVI